MSQMGKITINTLNEKESLGDMFGIFFEDINHAADGGLYAELVRNRAFEFSSIDNNSYNPLTAWEKISGHGAVDLYIESSNPVSAKNPHYLVIDVKKSGNNAGVRNMGFNTGIPLKEQEKYNFSCYIKRDSDLDKPVVVSLRSDADEIYVSKEISAGSEWKKYELEFEAPCTDFSGRLAVTVIGGGKVYIDFVSLFPADVFKGRKNGMRKDLAQMLADMKPKFMRFPGGCLVHGGSLDENDRDSMYRWKNTIGPVEDRPPRRNNWSYHQTLGLGYYEYFQLCEDIGAKAIPVVPGGFNPHFREGFKAVPLDKLQPYIDEALDLIEFAIGDKTTKWGKIRAELGHAEPFGLEYLAIGNEEIGEEFFERYEIIHNAVRAEYPQIKLANTAGPWSDGKEYDAGWESARKNKSDLVDEHYYQPPQWFLMNIHRYDDFKKEDPHVFLGEYGSWGHSLYNALAEAAYMTMLERNAHAVKLACYAPLFCNADYVNWSTNLIWYNNHEVYGTANYYVQKLFMNHQGDYLLDVTGEGLDAEPVRPEPVSGKINLVSERAEVKFYDIRIINDDTSEIKEFGEVLLNADNKEATAGDVEWNNYTIELKVKKLGDIVQNSRPRGFIGGLSIQFGCRDEKNKFVWTIGGRTNRLREIINGGDIGLSKSDTGIETDKEYNIRIKISGRHIDAFIDGELRHAADSKPLVTEPLYYTASKDAENGDIIIKAVNVSDESRTVSIDVKDMKQRYAKIYTMTGESLSDVNGFDNPVKVAPVETDINVSGNKFEYEFGKQSLTVIRFVK